MKRFILTGVPGAGKTALSLNWSLMASGSSRRPQPTLLLWSKRTTLLNRGNIPHSSIRLLNYKRRRQLRASHELDELQFHDRSAVCTAVLAVFLGYPYSEALSAELKRIKTEAIYQKRVFLIQNLGFITPDRNSAHQN
jgi:predicted ATPase